MIKKYVINDRFEVVELVRQNTPQFFHTSEESDFVHYLKNELKDYFVYEENSKIIGSGGINYFPKERLARISWDLVAVDSQGRGIGKKLTQFRIKKLNQNQDIEMIEVRTSQFVYKFYEKMGFTVEKIEKDFWAKKYDLYQMKMKNDCQIFEK